MKATDINHILILGAGTMGLRIGLQSAWSGYETVIYDIDPSSFLSARKVQHRILEQLRVQGLLDASTIEGILGRIRFIADPVLAAQDADLVSESVIEDLAVKRAVWRQFGELCPKHTVFTTNTSSFLPSMMAEESGRPERFCAFHFHDVFQANVVDIMPHAGTEPWICDLLTELGERMQQTPIIVRKESSGYIFNNMLMAIIAAAGALVTRNIATIEDVDRSWMGNFKMEAGPFGMLDAIGLDTTWHITRHQMDNQAQRFAAFLKTYLDAGKLGVKSGEGFYTYPGPAYRQPGFIHPTNK